MPLKIRIPRHRAFATHFKPSGPLKDLFSHVEMAQAPVMGSNRPIESPSWWEAGVTQPSWLPLSETASPDALQAKVGQEPCVITTDLHLSHMGHQVL